MSEFNSTQREQGRVFLARCCGFQGNGISIGHISSHHTTSLASILRSYVHTLCASVQLVLPGFPSFLSPDGSEFIRPPVRPVSLSRALPCLPPSAAYLSPPPVVHSFPLIASISEWRVRPSIHPSSHARISFR